MAAREVTMKNSTITHNPAGTSRTRLRARCRFAALMLPLLLAGCAGENAWTFRRSDSYRDDIQQLVEEKIDEQTQDLTGAQRWDDFKSNDFQTDPDLVPDRERLAPEAQQLLEAGPLSLADCLACCLEYNDRIQAGRAEMRSMGGEKLIAKSRFLPSLVYNLSGSAGSNIGGHFSQGAKAWLTLLEFGKDNPTDIALRDMQREALFGYERGTANVLSEVRLRFFRILVKKQQLAERRKLRNEFAARHDKMRKLEQARRVLEVDVLTAKLNVLNEEIRINSLEKEILREKMDLLHAMGLPVEMTDLDIKGGPEEFAVPLEESFEIALRRSTRIAEARAAVYEQDRVVRQLIYEYFPNIHIRGGYRGDSGAAGIDLLSEDDVYSAGPFAERLIDQRNQDNFESEFFTSTRSGWRGSVELELPLLKGSERKGRFLREKALLDRARHLLYNTISATELEVGKAYQAVLAEATETDILKETVRISKKRLGVQERMKEMGKITDNELETFRERFFSDQDRYFEQQIQLIEAQERFGSPRERSWSVSGNPARWGWLGPTIRPACPRPTTSFTCF